MKDILVWI